MAVKRLSSHRGDSLYNSEEIVNIIVEIDMKDIAIDMDFSAKALLFSINGDGLIDIKNLTVRLDISCANGKLLLNSLNVVQLKDYSIPWITGWSYAFNWLLKIIANSIVQKARQRIINAIENGGAKAIGYILDPLSVSDSSNSQKSLRDMKVKLPPNSRGKHSLSYNGSTVNIEVEIPLSDFETQTDYNTKALFSWINGYGFIDVKYLTMRLNISSRNGRASLYSLKTIHLGNYSTHLEELNAALNRLLNIIANSMNSGQKVIDILENISGRIIENMVDPISLPEFNCSNFNLQNIKVKPLSNLNSHGYFLLYCNGETANITAEISVKYIEIEADYSSFTGISWICGDGLVDVEHLAISLNVSIRYGKPRLNSFKVMHLDDYSVRWITGLTFLLNWLLKIIVNSRIKDEKKVIVDTLEKAGTEVLGNIMGQHI